MNVSVHDVLIPTRGGELPAWYFAAASAPESAPALVVIHDWYGRDDATREAAARLAEHYHVLVPDLFATVTLPESPTDASQSDFVQGLPDSRLVADVLAAVDWLAGQAGVGAESLGVVGWGWGGAYALMAAGHDSRLRVAADIGGAISYAAYTPKRPGSPLNFVANLEGALFAAFAGNDPHFPRIEVERLRARLVEHDKRGEVKIYEEAPPRFWRARAEPFTDLLWRRLENFLRDNMGHAEAFGEGYPNEASRLHA